jgi:hypothetical protein
VPESIGEMSAVFSPQPVEEFGEECDGRPAIRRARAFSGARTLLFPPRILMVMPHSIVSPVVETTDRCGPFVVIVQ